MRLFHKHEWEKSIKTFNNPNPNGIKGNLLRTCKECKRKQVWSWGFAKWKEELK